MMIYTLMQVAAFIQNLSEMLYKYVQYIRIYYLLPLAMTGGRNMFLLKNGQWIDTHVTVPHTEIDVVYDAEKHAIFGFGGEKPGRWPWLSVVVDGSVDISEFFSSLRITNGFTVTPKAMMMLYAHQCGTLYTGPIHVMDRSGEEYVVEI